MAKSGVNPAIRGSLKLYLIIFEVLVSQIWLSAVHEVIIHWEIHAYDVFNRV